MHAFKEESWLCVQYHGTIGTDLLPFPEYQLQLPLSTTSASGIHSEASARKFCSHDLLSSLHRFHVQQNCVLLCSSRSREVQFSVVADNCNLDGSSWASRCKLLEQLDKSYRPCVAILQIASEYFDVDDHVYCRDASEYQNQEVKPFRLSGCALELDCTQRLRVVFENGFVHLKNLQH